MLGHVAARYLSESGCDVVTSDIRYEARPCDPLIETIRESECAWVVNALGRVNVADSGSTLLFQANSLFPLQLRKRLRSDQRFIHASTDHVFSGRTGSYRVNSEQDANDEYGLSKMLGECVGGLGRTYVLRTSVIGPQLSGNRGLLSWFLRQQGAVHGFVNHYWNGLTTLEWSKTCFEIMNGQHPGEGPVWQVGVWPPVSKHDLLRMIGAIWDHAVSIEPSTSPEPTDRSLKPTWLRQALPEQLLEMKQWYFGHSTA
jgi:dTDP-4-dehydrorhamnose reductase